MGGEEWALQPQIWPLDDTILRTAAWNKDISASNLNREKRRLSQIKTGESINNNNNNNKN